VVDVLHPVARRGEQGHLVVDLVDAQQGRVADAVAHLGAQHFRPELLVARRIRRAQSDVAEPGDARVARRKVAPAAVVRSHHQVDAVAARVAEVREGLDVALFALLHGASTHVDAGIAEQRGRLVQVGARAHLETDGVVARIALEVHQRVIALVAAKVVRTGLRAGVFQPEDLQRILVRGREVSRAEADVADVMEVDHVRAFRGAMSCRNVDNVGRQLVSVK
jgi:hypothetical protein